ncbi:MAG: hypothetical protein JO062_21595 [Bryobacterales bacterium]|nr:hypothetical protein [Bryobacterales bacterium]
MILKRSYFAVILTILVVNIATVEAKKKGHKSAGDDVENASLGRAVLWTNPGDISSRNLLYGPGGKEHQPHGAMQFVEEDPEGTNPKFVVRDQDGVRWKVKLGLEARPETAASRIVWAAGYYTNEDYFMPDLHVDGMPEHLQRGQEFVDAGGLVHNVRLKRYLEGEKKIGEWKWEDNPFTNTRELNGLRVMMALINSWDLKDENNAIYEEKSNAGRPERIYMISDLGSCFGAPNLTFPLGHAKGDLDVYRGSKFIAHAGPSFIDFATPSGASLAVQVFRPREGFMRRRLEWIGKDVPRADVKWIAEVLSQLTPEQIADAFRAADYPFDKINGFVAVVVSRIDALKRI